MQNSINVYFTNFNAFLKSEKNVNNNNIYTPGKGD